MKLITAYRDNLKDKGRQPPHLGLVDFHDDGVPSPYPRVTSFCGRQASALMLFSPWLTDYFLNRGWVNVPAQWQRKKTTLRNVIACSECRRKAAHLLFMVEKEGVTLEQAMLEYL